MTEPGSSAAAFEASYTGVPPAWDIGRAQPVFVRLAAEGRIRAPVLDAGCGTGENALHLASLGLEVTGLDGAPSAIAKARAKARQRHIAVDFVLGDALHLEALGRRFASVIDSGLFHVFPDAERERYVASLDAAVLAGGRVHIMCFSERQPGGWGPRRVTEAELRAAFAAGWRCEAIVPEHFVTRLDAAVEAWLATFVRT
ncbi:MAG: class I SAM-dependent methyltransferase [Candidatus Limnocylindrales bacterium]